jgi:RNA polymerase sigma-70 factor, ECF subfamily
MKHNDKQSGSQEKRRLAIRGSVDFRIAEGNELDFRDIVDRYGNDLYRLSLSLIGNTHDAEDMVQETFLAGFERIQTFQGRSTVKTWLIGILLRKAAKFHRYRKIWQTVSLHLFGESEGISFDDRTAIDPTREQSLRMDIRKMLGSLSRKYREVVVLREVLGLSYQEIGEILKIPTGTVESRLFRARQQLRERYKEYLTE